MPDWVAKYWCGLQADWQVSTRCSGGMSDVNCKALVMPNEEDESSVRAPKELSCFEDLHILSAVRRIAVCPIMMITCG